MSEDWEVVPFAEIAQRRSSAWTPGEPTEVYVGLEHVAPYELRLAGTGVSDDVASNKTRFLAGDVLFGKLRPYFQKVVRPAFSGVCSTDMWAIFPIDESRVDPAFLHWVIANPAFSDFANSAETGTRMPRATWGWVSTYEVPLPPYDEQQRIGEVLGALDDRIEVARRLRKLLAQAAQAVAETSTSTCAVSELAIAERMQWYPHKSLGQVVDHYSLPAFDTAEEPDRVEADSIASNKLRIDGPRVLFSRLNPDTNRTWLSVPSDEVDVAVCSTEYAVLAPKKTSVALLWAVLSNGETGAHLAVATTGTSASHQRINEEALLAASIPDPRTLEVHQIDAVEAYISAYLEKGREIKALREARNLLLPRLVSGELRVLASDLPAKATT
jgi:type I restriction enzyme S subunit